MSYHPLANDSGSEEGRRREEASDLVDKLSPFLEELKPHEREFIETMGDGGPVSTKQLFWLRDIWGRVS